MNGAQICIFEQAYHVCLDSLLQREDGLRLEPQIRFVLLGDLTHQPLEWQLADEELSGFLELADLTKGNCARSESMRFLHSFVSHIRRFASSLVRQLLPRCLRPGILAGGLLCTCHLLFFPSLFYLLPSFFNIGSVVECLTFGFTETF